MLTSATCRERGELSYATVADLVDAVFDETRRALPLVQQRALAAALLRSEADEAAQPRTTATALVGVLAALSEDRPVLVAVDDVQWLDPASGTAIAFVARRLPRPVRSPVRSTWYSRRRTATRSRACVARGRTGADPAGTVLSRRTASPDSRIGSDRRRPAPCLRVSRRRPAATVLRPRDRAGARR